MTAYQIRENIRRMREFRNLNQEDLAEKLNLSTRAYANIENGRAGLDVERLLQISEILRIAFIKLLTLHLCKLEDVIDFLQVDIPAGGQQSVVMYQKNAQPGEPRSNDLLLPELLRQVEFLRQAYAEIQHDKSMLRAEIQEMKSREPFRFSNDC